MKRGLNFVVVVILAQVALAATPQIKNVKASQQYPWGMVYISYEVVGNITTDLGSGKKPILFVTVKDKATGHMYGDTLSATLSAKSFLSGDIGMAVVTHTSWAVSALKS